MMETISILTAFLLPLLGMMPSPVLALPDQPPPDPAEEAARFATVSGQVDLGGVVFGYLSVDGDLTAIGGYANSFLEEMRKIQPDVPPVNVPALLKITGLDAISAVAFSSVATGDGFRNKTYVHTPKGRRGLLRLMGGDSKPFEVVKLAPAGSDLVIEQDLNLKTLYQSVLEAAGAVMGEQGKAMVQMQLRQPLPPPLTFTLEKVMADLDTQITIIIDADPAKMVNVPDAKGMKMPQLSGAALIDGLGWIADELTKVLEPMLAQGGNQAPPFKIVRNANWVGIQLAIESKNFSASDRKEISELGWDTAILAHHRPSGKLVLASGKEFADKLFAPKLGLGQDPVFQKTMKDLPMEGTALTYASPAFFSSLREFFEKVNELENDKEHEQDDRFVATTFINLLLPKNARGEGRVTTNTKNGMLTISNSAHSHKTSIVTSAASPIFMIGGYSLFQAKMIMGEMEFPEAEQIIEEVDQENRPRPNRKFDRIGD
ncbi:MAG: hypothetical protein VCA18_06735 [Opitutales bacterium]